MARMTRLYAPGCSHHIIQRGNNRATCFHEDGDYLRYLELLQIAAHQHGVAIHAFVLMTNHVHLLLTPDASQSCGRMMQSLGRRYVRYFNDRYGRTGTLWEGRYKSTLVDTDTYYFAVSRYIELNPVRANMVPEPADHPWSSYQGNALGCPCPLLTTHRLYQRLGRTDAERQRSYRCMFDQPVPSEMIEVLRYATNRSWVFGSESFRRSIAQTANRPAESSGWGGDRRSGKQETDQGV